MSATVCPTGLSDWSDRPVGRSLGRTDRSVRRSYRVNAQLEALCNALYKSYKFTTIYYYYLPNVIAVSQRINDPMWSPKISTPYVFI